MKKKEQFHVSFLVEAANESSDVIYPETWYELSLFFEIECIRLFYAKMWSEVSDF